jgi:hypothetical protein
LRRNQEDLPADNVARVVLYDALMDAANDHGFNGIARDDLIVRVIPRLRVVVPRELHIQGEAAYVQSKIDACLEAGLLQEHARQEGLLIPGTAVPRVRYPDGSVHDYTAGLEAARERLEADEGRLRQGGFDVRQIIRSPADTAKDDRYLELKASMAEFGFLDSCPITVSASGAVVDGRARQAAAVDLGIVLKKPHHVKLPARRDTPLQHALLVLTLNADRLQEEQHAEVQEAIAKRAGRPWLEIERDLALTREWRLVEPREYDAKLDVVLVPFTDRSEPKVQVTTDGSRVMLRSVMREAGIPEYSREHILQYVSSEDARTQYSGRQAIFVGADDALRGIARMQAERRERGLKVDTGWDDIHAWLQSLPRRLRVMRGTAGEAATTDHTTEVGGELPS